MSNIHEHLDQIDQELAQEAGYVVDEVSQFDPGVMWTPLIISAMVMMAIFAMCKYLSLSTVHNIRHKCPHLKSLGHNTTSTSISCVYSTD